MHTYRAVLALIENISAFIRQALNGDLLGKPVFIEKNGKNNNY